MLDQSLLKNKYDVIIIGSGIGGLICGCYLAKAGFRVLIVEQHSAPGGCCTSFSRKGFIFDVGVHYLGSLREEGILRKVINELDLSAQMDFIRTDPTDRIIMPDKTIFIRQDKNRTKEELALNFPHEKDNIIRFFDFICKTDFFTKVSKTKTMTFNKMLDIFFKDYKIKSTLSVLLGNIGLPPSRASALASIILFEEYIFDGGYYPRGGMQTFVNLIAAKFEQYGGALLLSTKVTNIIIKEKKVTGVKIEDEKSVFSEFVVSNSDATFTFNTLLDCETEEKRVVKKLNCSTSAFVIYLGLNKKISINPKHYTTWRFFTYDIEKCYGSGLNLTETNEPSYILCTFSSLNDSTLAPKNKSAIRVLIWANFKSKSDCHSNKHNICDKMMEKVELIIPNINECVEVKEVATPRTFYRFTLNKNGAIYGWSAETNQIDKNVFPSKTTIDNLYLTGHWVTKGVGQSSVSLVALCGRNTAKSIIRKRNHECISHT